KVYLQGRVPDQATSDEIRDQTTGVVGPDNVVVQYVVDPTAPRPNSAPLFVRDSVLFGPNSLTINDTARGVLDLGFALMTQNPAVTIDINGYTDSDGTDETNIALSQQRVDVIFMYLVSKGIDPSRLTRTAHGEADPVADNSTPEGRAQNRRVEFTVNNLLG
ncbi:MAG TPA: OmpA family protein, partial [Microthrixaceae bacterium]|nr:OmpA family protein [Microthrixaceae bacterium]